MKVHIALGCLAISALGTAEMAAAANTKTVDMRETIIPEWDDVAKDAPKLTADTMDTYWNRLEQEDLKRYSSPLPTKKERIKAKKSINDFYNSAATCLGRNFPTPIKKAAFSTTMSKVRDCIKKDAKMPKFPVAVTPAPTTKPVTTPAPTAKPGSATTAPTAKPSSGTIAPTVEDTDDDDTPDANGDDGVDGNTFVTDIGSGDDDETVPGTTVTPAYERTGRPASTPTPEPSFAYLITDVPTSGPKSESPSIAPMSWTDAAIPTPNAGDPVYDPKTWTHEPTPAPLNEDPVYDPMATSSSPSPDFASTAEYPGDTTPRGDTPSPDGIMATPFPADPIFPATGSLPAAGSGFSSAKSPLDYPTSSFVDEPTPVPATGRSSHSELPSSKAPFSPQASPSVDDFIESPPDVNTDSAFASTQSLPGGDVASNMPTDVVTQPAAATYVSDSATFAPQQQPQSPICPTRDTVPALSVLDSDTSGNLSILEWLAWVNSLKSAANKIVTKTKDPVAKNFLDMIVEDHYYNLQECVLKNFNSVRVWLSHKK